MCARRSRRWMISEGRWRRAGDSELSAINRATLAVFMARHTHSIITSLVFVKQNGPAKKVHREYIWPVVTGLTLYKPMTLFIHVKNIFFTDVEMQLCKIWNLASNFF